MTEFEVQPFAWVVKPKGAAIFGETATTITRDDEGAGQYLVVSQCADKDQKIRITHEEWPALKSAIEAGFDQILADELHEFEPKNPS